jgi:HTH-type transcriptional regulator, sugar sensing transcriptional regulator
MLRQHIEPLMHLGFSEKEARVYLALLGEGASTAEHTARVAKLNRSTTYVQLDALIERKLVSTLKKSKKTLFVVEPPQNLELMHTKRIEELTHQRLKVQQVVPELTRIYAATGARPVIRPFEGREGLIQIREDVIASKEKQLFAAFSFDDLYRIFTQEELMDFSRRRAKAGITSYVLYNKEGEPAVVVPPQELRRVAKKQFPFSSDVYIYGDTVSIASTSGHISGVTIVNREVAQTMRSLYNLAWEAAQGHEETQG